MSNKIHTIPLLIFECLGFLFVLVLPTDVQAQLSHLSGELCLIAQNDRYSQSGGVNDEQLLMQQYLLNARGFIADPRFLAFDVTSSFLDYSSKLTMRNASSSTHRRDWGYYDASLILFPDNGFRLTMSMKKNRIESKANSPLLSSRGMNNPGVMNIEGIGGNVFIPGNTIYPQITAGLNQETQIGEQLAYPVDQKTTNYNVRLSNANSERSLYNFTYLGYDLNDKARNQRLTNHEFRLHGQSDLATRFLVNADALYALRNDTRNTALEVLADDQRSETVQHRVRLSHLVSSYIGPVLQRSATDHISSMSLIRTDDNLTIRLGGSLQFATQQSAARTLRGDEEKLSFESQYDRNLSAMRLTVLLGSDLGLERVFGRQRTFVHSSRLGCGVIGNLLSNITYTLRDDFNLQRQAILGDAWGNTLRAEVKWDIFWRLNLNSRFNRTDTRNLTSKQIPDLSNTVWESSITWNVGANTTLMANYTRRASSSWYEDLSTRYMAGISQSEFIPRFSFSFTADQTYSTLSRQTVAHVEGELRYRLYALSIVGRYIRDVIGEYDRSRFQIEIRRPIDVAF